jgi:hypothetical protein
MTPSPDFSSRKCLLIQYLRLVALTKADAKVIKIREFFGSPNSQPQQSLRQKNF